MKSEQMLQRNSMDARQQSLGEKTSGDDDDDEAAAAVAPASAAVAVERVGDRREQKVRGKSGEI